MTSFSLHPLPFDRGDLAPWISSKTVEFHYGKHHKGYVDKLNLLTRGAPAAGQPLEQIITSSEGALFETAAQVWNRDLYWKSLAPDGPRRGLGELEEVVQRQFGGLPSLREQMIETGVGHFGSGYLWLYWDPSTQRVSLQAMHDADSPLLREGVPLWGIDLWEHAYYLDYQNRRGDYIGDVFDHLLNWHFAEDNWRKSLARSSV